MPRKPPREPAPVPLAPPPPPKKRKLKAAAAKREAKGRAAGVKASKDRVARVKAAERAIRAGDPPPKRTTAEEIALAERRLEALGYARMGYGPTEIGQFLDPPCTRASAHRLVKEALAELKTEVGESAEHVRAMQLQQLDAMIVKPLENATKGDPQSIAATLKIMERQAALVGADAPKQTTLTGANGGPVQQEIVIRRIVVPVPNRGGAA